jgi:hypothetical protein
MTKEIEDRYIVTLQDGAMIKCKRIYLDGWGFVAYNPVLSKLFLLTNPRTENGDGLYDAIPILGEDIKIAKKPLAPDSKCTIEGEVYDLKLIDSRIFATSSEVEGKKFLLKYLGRNEDWESMDYMAIRCPNIDKR